MLKYKFINSRYFLTEFNNKTYIVETIDNDKKMVFGGLNYLNFKGKAALVDESNLEYVTKMVRSNNIGPWAGILGILGVQSGKLISSLNMSINRGLMLVLCFVLILLSIQFIRNQYDKKIDDRLKFNKQVNFKRTDGSNRNYLLSGYAIAGILLMLLWLYLQVRDIILGIVQVDSYISHQIILFLGLAMYQAVNIKKYDVEISA